MMERMMGNLRSHVDQRVGQIPTPRWGTVTSVDPARHMVRVTVEPEHGLSLAAGGPGVVTGWLQVLSPSVGQGWGLVSLPMQGQQVLVIPEGQDAEHGVVLGAAFSAGNRPPSVPSAPDGPATNVQPGEAALVSATGAVIRLTADGGIFSSGPWTHQGTFTTTGDLSDRHGSLDRLRQAYDQHTHAGVQPGSGTTATPLPQDPE